MPLYVWIFPILSWEEEWEEEGEEKKCVSKGRRKEVGSTEEGKWSQRKSEIEWKLHT